MPPSTIPAHQIDHLILREFHQQNGPEPLRDQYQELLIEAHRSGNFRQMALVLEHVGDHFSRSGNGVQEAVRMYQSAVFCLSHDPAEAVLTGLVEGLNYNRKGYQSSSGNHFTPDIFQTDQLEGAPDLNRPDPDINIRLLFKAGTSMALQVQYERAGDFYDKALQLSQAQHSGNEVLRGRILANRGVALRKMGQLAGARESLNQALKIFTKHGLRYEEAKILSLLAGIEQADRKHAAAGRLYSRALALYAAFGAQDARGKARTCTGAGILYLEKRNFKRALQHFDTAWKCAEGLPIPDLLWPIQWGLGCCYLAKKDYDPAEKQLASSIRHIEQFQDDLCSDEGKATFIENVQFVYSKMFEVLIGCQRKFKRSFDALLHLMERSRAQAMQDLFDAQQPENPYAAEVSSKQPIGRPQIYTQQPNMAIAAPEYQPQDSEIGQRIRRLEERRAEQVGLPFRSPKRLVFKILPKHTIALVVNESGQVTAGHIIRKGQPAWEQDLAAFRATIGHQHFGLRDVAGMEEAPLLTPADADALFRKLYDALLRPLQKHLPHQGELLLVEPDGPLWQLPLHLLRLPDGRYAGDVWPMVYTPSFQTYEQAKKAVVLPIRRDDWFFFGGLSKQHRIGDITFKALDFAKREVEIVAEDILGIPAQHTFVEDACTETAARQHIPGSRIVHLATHGEAKTDDPSASYVALLGRTLTADVVRQLPLPHCELVVLSACKSGLGKVMSEGMVGLARAFQLAGARSLLVSLWSVEDASTQWMMDSFYRHLKANGGHKALALQSAMQAVRQMPGKEAPLYWAPFVLIGVEDCILQLE